MYYSYLFVSLFMIKSVVEIKRLELLTSCVQGRRSSQLSYIPTPCILSDTGELTQGGARGCLAMGIAGLGVN